MTHGIRGPDRPTIEILPRIFEGARHAVTREYHALEGHGFYKEHRIALHALFVSLGAAGLAVDVGDVDAAKILRQIADKLEREGRGALQSGWTP